MNSSVEEHVHRRQTVKLNDFTVHTVIDCVLKLAILTWLETLQFKKELCSTKIIK